MGADMDFPYGSRTKIGKVTIIFSPPYATLEILPAPLGSLRQLTSI